MSKAKFPRLTDKQFYAEMQPLNDSLTFYAACWECNAVVSVAADANERMADLKHHDTHNARHLAFVAALNVDPGVEVEGD